MTVAARRHMGVLVVVGFVLAALMTTAPAWAGEPTDYVLYYTVNASYQGRPENLSEIAERFLGDSSRSTEIFNLNVGRTQPDGGSLQSPTKLHAGWELILPWDAVGPSVQNGVLPTTAPTPTPSPGSSGKGKSPTGGTKPSQTAHTSAPAGGTGSTQGCLAAAGKPGGTDWASQRLNPSQAWQRTRGTGELVAVLDSGVDGGLSQLSGHVAVGADIVAGTGRGDTDCVGSGTAMAALIAAQPSQGSTVVGIAPEATVLPIRVAANNSHTAEPSDEATAIEVAVSAGATVIVLGGYVDPGNDQVAKAITTAVQHDAVVVAGAPAATATPIASGNEPGVLYVGATTDNGGLPTAYQPGAVNVLAPGVNVASLGVTGTSTTISRSGTQYAAALVGGAAALVRSAYPKLNAAQVAHRIEVTSDGMGGAVPDARYGWGMIDLSAALTQTVPGESVTSAAPGVGSPVGNSSAGRDLLLVAVCAVGLLAIALLIMRGRRIVRGEPGDDGEDGYDDQYAPPPSPFVLTDVGRTDSGDD